MEDPYYNLSFFRSVGEASKRKVLDWPTRLSVCIGAARGTSFLYKNTVHSYAGIEQKNAHAIEGHDMLLNANMFCLVRASISAQFCWPLYHTQRY